MKHAYPSHRRRKKEFGETLVGLLIATAVGSLILVATASTFTSSMRSVWDRITIAEANNHAREIAHLLAADFRVIGSGMPLGSPGFDMLDITLGDAPLPVLADSTPTLIRYRLNEYGRFTSLTNTFDPSTDTNLSVLSTDRFTPHTLVYISNFSSEFSQSSTIGGAKGRLSSAGTSTLSLTNVIAKTGIKFNPGSTVEPVSEISLDCQNSEGISRDNGTGPLTLYPKSSCSLEYLDSSQTALTVPLSAEVIKSSLTSIRVTVTVPGRRPLRKGTQYAAQATETVALRNLILGRSS